MLVASLPRWCATSPMARHTWPVRVAAIPLHARTICETHCIAATQTPLHAPNHAALGGAASVLAFWHPFPDAFANTWGLFSRCCNPTAIIRDSDNNKRSIDMMFVHPTEPAQ